jgi:hypothetical protein
MSSNFFHWNPETELDEEFETINIGIIVANQINRQYQPTFASTPV